MATGTDPLQREQIGVVSRDTGDRYTAPSDNSALRLARSLQEVQPAVSQTLNAIAAQKQTDAEAQAKAKAIETSGAALADAVRMGAIRPTQNPWFISAYNRESAAIRGQDQLSKLSTDSASWEERSDPQAFAKRWHTEVGTLMQGYAGDADTIKGFTAAEGQATQQALATNQAYNSQRIFSERLQNLGALAADALQKAVIAGGGHISGSDAAIALAPAKQQWIATGGTLDDWNEKIMVPAVTTASYSIRSPGLIDLLKAPELTQGPRPGDTSRYGDGADPETPDLPDPLKPLPQAPEAKPMLVSGQDGVRLAWPAQGRITNDYAQHRIRGSHGVDIAVPNGTKLRTPVGGTAQIGNDPRSGLFVRITSPDGKVVSSLAHLSVAHVTNGQKVAPGEVVAFSGQTGHATGPHVHWRVKVDGKDVDPLHYTPGQQALADQSHVAAQAAVGNQAPALAVGPAPDPQPVLAGGGPSLYDIPGIADKAESDRYRISSALRSEAGDRLQAITNQRKLDGLKATDQLYSTFGTSVITGGVDTATIVKTLSGAGYSPQVIAQAVSNVRDTVGDSEGLSTARLSLNSNQPGPAKEMFDLATEGRTKGYSEDYEQRVGAKVISGELSATEGITMVGSAVSRSEQVAADARTQVNFDAAHPPGARPGSFIKKAGQINAGVDTLASTSFAAAQSIMGRVMSQKQLGYHKAVLKQVILEYLASHPSDFGGAEQAARDYVANFLRSLQAQSGRATPQPQPASSGGNPRR